MLTTYITSEFNLMFAAEWECVIIPYSRDSITIPWSRPTVRRLQMFETGLVGRELLKGVCLLYWLYRRASLKSPET
jgi:hypothetical protein